MTTLVRNAGGGEPVTYRPAVPLTGAPRLAVVTLAGVTLVDVAMTAIPGAAGEWETPQPDVPVGTYLLRFTAPTAAGEMVDPTHSLRVDLPVGQTGDDRPLLISATEFAARRGLTPDETLLARIGQEILAAHDDVAALLGYPVPERTVVETVTGPRYRTAWAPTRTVATVTLDADTRAVTYVAGRSDQAVLAAARRYVDEVVWAALLTDASLTNDGRPLAGYRAVRSVAVEGQSVSWDTPGRASGSPLGALERAERALRRFRRLGVRTVV